MNELEKMKDYQFEELTFWLSLIAYLLCKTVDVPGILTGFIGVVCIFNFINAIYVAIKNRKSKKI